MSNHSRSRSEHKGGIQELLVAEQRAAAKINDSKNKKLRRLKEARDEAQREIETYRKELQNEFEQRLNSDKLGDEFSVQMQRKVTDEMKGMDTQVKLTKNKVIESVISRVYSIYPELHQNLKINVPKVIL